MGAVEFVDQLALEQNLDRRNAAHAEMLGELGFSSELTLASRKRPLYSSASFSSIGFRVWQGSHQGAQKSTTTGTVCGEAADLGFEIFNRNVKGTGT
jgi:hypothetical protein